MANENARLRDYMFLIDFILMGLLIYVAFKPSKKEIVMATLPKIIVPRTPDGFQKKLDYMNQAGIDTKEDAYKYATLMLASINFEIDRLKGHESNPLVAGLIERYKPMKERWEKRLEFTKQQLLVD